MMKPQYLLIISLALFLSGCGGLSGPKLSQTYESLPAPSVSESRVVFMRPDGSSLSQDARIHLDGKRIVELPDDGCWVTNLPAGQHEMMLDLWGDIGDQQFKIEFEPRQSYFFLIDLRESRRWSSLFGVLGHAVESGISNQNNNGTIEMRLIPESKALSLMNDCVDYRG